MMGSFPWCDVVDTCQEVEDEVRYFPMSHGSSLQTPESGQQIRLEESGVGQA